MLNVSKDVANVAAHNSMSIETNAEAAPMRVNLGSPEVYPRPMEFVEPPSPLYPLSTYLVNEPGNGIKAEIRNTIQSRIRRP